MKYLLLACGLSLATVVNAQTTAPPKYCLLYTKGGSFSSPGLRLDYGQNLSKELAVQDAALATLTQYIERLHSVPAALNHLDSQGWEVIQATSLPDGNAQGSASFLLRRKP
jgi:hypothetical protein